MRRLTLAVLTALALAAPVKADDLEFSYALELQRGGSVVQTNFLRGFEKGDGLNLNLRLKESAYIYIVASNGSGFRLVYPDPMHKVSAGVSDKLGPIKVVHMSDDPGVHRLYLVVSKERVPEFESLLGSGKPSLTELQILDVRDRYSKNGVYTRNIKDGMVDVKFVAASGVRPLVVEEISLRHAPVAPVASSAPRQ